LKNKRFVRPGEQYFGLKKELKADEYIKMTLA
jgi:hypothetical protein